MRRACEVADELMAVPFNRISRTLEITFGHKTAATTLVYYSCGMCGALLDEDEADRQLHANWHGKIERHARDLHAHTSSFTGHGIA